MAEPVEREHLRRQVLGLYERAIEAARPDVVVHDALAVRPVEVPDGGCFHVIAFGKAAGAMMHAALESLPETTRGERLVVTNYENETRIDGVRVLLAGHPIPDAAGLKAALEVERVAARAGADDVLLCLISGGGSALLPAPVDGMGLAEKAGVNELLLGSGADIRQTNLVRQRLSRLKGGGLARQAAPARVISLILSDVIGDDLSVVASGPTVSPIGTRAEAVATLHELGIWEALPDAVVQVLTAEENDTPVAPSEALLVGSNRMSLLAMLELAGDEATIVTDALVGSVEEAARFIVGARLGNPQRPVLLFGGETTVKLRGSGVGGRNQELALRVALEAERRGLAGPWVFLSGGTDGRDGPTSAAGACVDDRSLDRLRRAGGDAERYLADSDSYHALERSGDLIPQRATGTNVADVQVFISS
ncbi:glycerate kinase [Palleronia sp.]|uniref:glycerate kinase type-2 family protein n=1 Tax=Palleronia sp. TaxID=1940284 RepID=UPI0035C812F3